MTLPKLTDLIKKTVVFNRYQDGNLWYHAIDQEGTTFEFPIPIKDTGVGVFLPADKGIFFMRWIRKHLEYLHASLNAH